MLVSPVKELNRLFLSEEVLTFYCLMLFVVFVVVCLSVLCGSINLRWFRCFLKSTFLQSLRTRLLFENVKLCRPLFGRSNTARKYESVVVDDEEGNETGSLWRW